MRGRRINKKHKSNWNRIFIVYPNRPPFYYQLDEEGRLKIRLPRKPQRNIANSFINLFMNDKITEDHVEKSQTNNEAEDNNIIENEIDEDISLNIDLKPIITNNLPDMTQTESSLLSTNLFDISEHKIDFSANNIKLLDPKSFELNSFGTGPAFI